MKNFVSLSSILSIFLTQVVLVLLCFVLSACYVSDRLPKQWRCIFGIFGRRALGHCFSGFFFFFNLYYSMILPISDLKDRVEILLIKCRGLIKLDKAQMRLTFKGKMELNRDVM